MHKLLNKYSSQILLAYIGWANFADSIEQSAWPQHLQSSDATKYFHCDTIGKFPRNDDCNIFHICLFPNMFTIEEFSCPPGKSLDVLDQICMEEGLARCKTNNTGLLETTREHSNDSSSYKVRPRAKMGFITMKPNLDDNDDSSTYPSNNLQPSEASGGHNLFQAPNFNGQSNVYENSGEESSSKSPDY